MAQTGTINDLLEKNEFDNPREENLAAGQLRKEKMGQSLGGSNSLDSLMGMASGIGGAGREEKMEIGSSRDNLGRPVRPESPLPASRQSQVASEAGVDNRLLAGRLREERNQERENRKKTEKGENQEEETKKGEGLRDRIGRLKDRVNLKNKAKAKIEKAVIAPAQQGTNQLLRAAWGSLIPSFGMSLIYINIHVFLRFVLGEKLFCRLGEEWIPKEALAVAGEAGKTGGKAIGLVEVMGLLILDLMALAIIAVVLTLLIMIVDFMQQGFAGKAVTIIGGLTKLGWTSIKGLFNLF